MWTYLKAMKWGSSVRSLIECKSAQRLMIIRNRYWCEIGSDNRKTGLDVAMQHEPGETGGGTDSAEGVGRIKSRWPSEERGFFLTLEGGSNFGLFLARIVGCGSPVIP